MDPRFTPLAGLIAILVLLAPVPGLADGIEVADKQGVPAQNPAPEVTAGEEGDDPEDNPDQGAGWTWPGKVTGGDRPVERALPRPADAAPESAPGPAPEVTAGEEGDDPEDNPDQGLGWTWPGKATRDRPVERAPPRPAYTAPKAEKVPAGEVTAGEEGDDPEDNPDQGLGWTWPGKAKGGKSPAKSALPPTDDAAPGTAPAVTAGEEGDDPEDNPDQGGGFTWPGEATGGDRPVERASPRPADAAPEGAPGPAPAVTAGEEGDDPGDNPDQGAGWTWPGKAKGNHEPQGP